MPQTRPANPPKPCEYIFISVHYKHGEWSAEAFPSLRAGLEDFAREYSALAGYRSNDPTLLERLLNMDDATLMHQVIALGSSIKRQEIRPGLVGIIENDPNREEQDKVYLEMYYKHGEWSLAEGSSQFLDEIMGEMDEEDYEDEEQMEEEALEQSQARIRNQRGWGVQDWWYGTIIGEAEEM
ncbi:hypothetical protein BDZ89DRAFT_1062347 [Hymenopellis radicata]|nr:hypothetical protein BDZ89DRAFT_1062347 [Hymenopellis radicata]